MKKISLIFLINLILLVSSHKVSGQTIQITLRPAGSIGKDAPIFNCAPCGYDTTNYGNFSELNAIAWTHLGNISNVRSLIQFYLDTIPSDANVESAYLSLYFNPSSSNGQHSSLTGANDAFLKKITFPWNENTVTWNNQPATTSNNQVYFPQSISASQDYLNMNVTSIVQEMVANPASNYGFMLQLVTETFYRRLIFASSDHADSTKHPTLDVYYTMPSDSLEIPNVFTPNNDGINEIFTITSQNFQTLNCKIYNRWGILVGELQSINDAWDGRTTSGIECPTGVYFYILNALTDNQEYIQRGTVQLIR